MGETVWETALENAMHNAFKQSSVFAAHTIGVQRALQHGDYGPSWVVDAVGQSPRDWNLVETYAFMLIWTDIRLGETIASRIYLGETPNADEELGLNQHALDKLPSIFHTSVERRFDSDGAISWINHLTLGTSRAPLEIGSSRASRTWGHLLHPAGVMRWPYCSKDLVLLRRKTPYIAFKKSAHRE